MSRLWGLDRMVFARRLAREYADGATVRAIAAKHGRSYGSVHDLLALAGTAFRPRSGNRPGKPEGEQP